MWQFIMLSKVVLTFKSVDETLACDHSNESSLKGIFTYCFIKLSQKIHQVQRKEITTVKEVWIPISTDFDDCTSSFTP